VAEVITIGPYHPALFEPELYEVTVRDGKIVNVAIKQGFTHRGIERLMETKTYNQNLFLCERVCGICSHAHTCCYCQTVERIFGAEPPERAQYLRTLVFELERLESHYLWFALFFHALHEEGQFIKVLNGREKLMDLLELVCGNRVHYAINAIGGVRRDLSEATAEKIRRTLGDLEGLSENILSALRDVAPRLSGVGPLPKEKASAFGVVGPILRASGIKSDIRVDDPYAAYPEVDFEVQVEEGGDVFTRAMVRAKETCESIKIVRQLLDNLPAGELKVEVGEPREGEEVGRVEAPRGELAYYIRSNGTNLPTRVKIRTPTYMNERAASEVLLEQELGNLPVILESLDRCISCTNRITLIDARTGRRRLVSLGELR